MLYFFFVFFVSWASALAPLYDHPTTVDTHVTDEYLVVFHDTMDLVELEEQLNFAVGRYKVLHQYRYAVKGFAARLSKGELVEVRKNLAVSFVEVNQIVTTNACSSPVKALSWGLNRISEKNMFLNGFYSYPSTAGEGVNTYVIDTGIYVANEDFQGRATFGYCADDKWKKEDLNGHGTHVASTIVGSRYGVARKAKVIAVKVLGDDGSGTDATVIAGIDWVVSQHKSKKKPSVANLSLGGSRSVVLNAAADSAVEAGVVLVVAAGNDNNDACTGSPSSAAQVITVGATDIGTRNTDVRSYFSSFGSCVDIFAPGSDITAAWIGYKTATNTISGTSMASPHVAGVATLLLGENPSAKPATIKNLLISTGTKDKIDMACSSSSKICPKSPNILLFNGCTQL